jgi:catechol 2,3-dioxygenase-like lactoylglutathione lyase family enzyme
MATGKPKRRYFVQLRLPDPPFMTRPAPYRNSSVDGHGKNSAIGSHAMTLVPILRVARPTDNLEALLRFYEQGLGFGVLYRFEDHDGFDGVMLGRAGAPYHFEFTAKRGHAVGRAPTPDNLLVFYLPETDAWKAAVQRLRDAGFRSSAVVQSLLGSQRRDVRGPGRLSHRAPEGGLDALSAAKRPVFIDPSCAECHRCPAGKD